MDAQIQVSSDDFEVNSALGNSSYSEESESMFQMVKKQKKFKGQGKQQQQQKQNIKKAIKKRDIVKKSNQQILDKNITSNNQQMIQKKQNNLRNKFDEYIAEVFDSNYENNLLINQKEKDKINQEIIQENFNDKIQVQNQFHQINSEVEENSSISEPQEEQIQANQNQQNQIQNYLSNAGQFQYLRTALSKDSIHQPILFKRFLNYLQMTQEEYDNIKQSFPDIPSEYLPQVILEQKQINKVFYNKQPQQQQQQLNNQQQQQNNQNQQIIQQQQNQLNFIQTEFKFNPNLSDGNLECAICAQTYLNGDKLAILPCIHRFHLTCFTSWLKKSTQCPICYHG